MIEPPFSPAGISASFNLPVLEEHVTDAAFLWHLRERAIRAPHYKLSQLALLDGRVIAHLEGLRAAGAGGIDQARFALRELDASTLFVMAYLAFRSHDRQTIRDVMAIALSDAALLDAAVGALAWQPLEALEETMSALSRSGRPEYRRMALAAYAAHRWDPGILVERAADDSDSALRARALRAIGELGRLELAESLRRGLSDPELLCRIWASWSLALLGEPHAPQMLFEQAGRDPQLSRMAIDMAMRTAEPAWGRQLIRELCADDDTLRLAVVAAGSFGDVSVVPWLLELTAQPEVARAAAEAFAMLTGAELELAALKRDAPQDAPPSHEEDEDLRWPNPDGLRRWWSAERARFQSGARYIAGQPVSEGGALHVLRRGYQRQRRGAAILLAHLRRGEILVSTSRRADWQRLQLPS